MRTTLIVLGISTGLVACASMDDSEDEFGVVRTISSSGSFDPTTDEENQTRDLGDGSGATANESGNSTPQIYPADDRGCMQRPRGTKQLFNIGNGRYTYGHRISAHESEIDLNSSTDLDWVSR